MRYGFIFCFYERCLVFLTFVPKETQGHGINYANLLAIRVEQALDY